MNKWENMEFDKTATLSKDKFNPKKETANKICIELEHIAKETGRFLDQLTPSYKLA